MLFAVGVSSAVGSRLGRMNGYIFTMIYYIIVFFYVH